MYPASLIFSEAKREALFTNAKINVSYVPADRQHHFWVFYAFFVSQRLEVCKLCFLEYPIIFVSVEALLVRGLHVRYGRQSRIVPDRKRKIWMQTSAWDFFISSVNPPRNFLSHSWMQLWPLAKIFLQYWN